jgi:uncharacterized protein
MRFAIAFAPKVELLYSLRHTAICVRIVLSEVQSVGGERLLYPKTLDPLNNIRDRPMKPEPLTDAEIDHLSAILERFANEGSMNLEQLDGFLAAVICGPEFVPPSKFLPEIWGDQTVFEDTSTAQEFLSLIMRHWNAIADILNAGEIYLPLLLEDESGIARGNDWADGFLRGMEFGREDWALLLNDEDHGGSLMPIFALANENNPDPEMRPYKGPVSAELRETLIVGAVAGLAQIYRYFKAQRMFDNGPLGDMPTFLRKIPKIGRNDPCPCGSGKKFKQCCGKTALH